MCASYFCTLTYKFISNMKKNLQFGIFGKNCSSMANITKCYKKYNNFNIILKK